MEGCTLKKDIRQPRRLAVRAFPPGVEVPREQTLRETFRSFQLRMQKRAAAGPIPGDKENNHFTALQAPPGSGKSFFLDIIARAACESAEGRKIGLCARTRPCAECWPPRCR